MGEIKYRMHNLPELKIRGKEQGTLRIQNSIIKSECKLLKNLAEGHSFKSGAVQLKYFNKKTNLKNTP